MVTLSGKFGLKGGRFDRFSRFEHFNQIYASISSPTIRMSNAPNHIVRVTMA